MILNRVYVRIGGGEAVSFPSNMEKIAVTDNTVEPLLISGYSPGKWELAAL